MSNRRRSSLGVASVATTNNDSAGTIPAPSADSIKVLCRFRPPSRDRDSYKPGSRHSLSMDTYKIDDQRNEIEFTSDLSDGKSFTFDKVFGSDSTQTEVFQEVNGVVTSVMDGFNGTIMAYGQTSAGKSYTMEGLSLWDPESQGVIPRCVDALFEEINKADSNIQFQVILSFYEIYCEKIRDLLNPQQINLKIRETRNNGFIVQDITEVYCTDRESVLRVIEVGKANRITAPTLMNAESSRSHSIVSIIIDQKNLSTGRNKRGILFLVDLAGSEKVSKTGASGMRLEEAKNINSSLTTLGMVINALCDGSSHVPYRDSKLTMILTDALGGNSKTTLIICCNPDARHIPETISTLRFGERAKRIKNNARINEEFSVEELKAMLQQARKEILQLKNRLRLSDIPGDLNTPTDTGSNDDDSTSYNNNRQSVVYLKDHDFMSKDEEKRLEIATLKAKIIALEEELEMERIRSKEEHEQRLLIMTEAEALKHTISELEEKMLKVALSQKKRQSIDPNDSQDNIVLERKRTKSSASATASLQVSSSDSVGLAGNGHAHSSLLIETPPTRERRNSHPHPHHQNNNKDGRERRKSSEGIANAHKGSRSHDDEWDEEEVDEEGDDDDSEDFEFERKRRGNSINELNKHGLYLNSQLEQEIRGLTRSINDQQNETKHAQESAQQYAEKYIKLREEYELHVQVLMMKLTQEQQARTIIEDKLEDAYMKLWSQTKKGKKNKGFFATWFGYKDKAGALSPASSKALPPHLQDMTFTDREQNISRSLEVAQGRVSQLVAELEATKEAQMIVLETKEAVMRSLARQNSQLTMERDTLNRRVEEMTNTIDQLTNLLRNVQQRAVKEHAAHAHTRGHHVAGAIKGGHRHSDRSEPRDQNQDRNSLVSVDHSRSSEDNTNNSHRNVEVVL